MRILLLTQWFQPEPMFKGLPLAKELVSRGHEVEVLTGFPNYPDGKLYPGYRIQMWHREIKEGVRINRLPLYPSHDKSGLRRICTYLSFAISCLFLGPIIVRKPDVIFVYNLITLGPPAFLMRLLFGSKVLIDVQDIWPDAVSNSGMLHNSLANRFLALISKWVYNRADWITVISPGFKQALEHRGVAINKIEVIYNWCDEDSLSLMPHDEALAKEFGLSGKFNLLFAGTMGVMQRLDIVLEAAAICSKKSPSVQFVLMGGGVERNRLEDKAINMGLNNVRFLPRQPTKAMGQFYGIVDALLVHLCDDPALRITIPSKIQTYLYMGKPIVIAMEGDGVDLVEQPGAGLICKPMDAVALAETVSNLVAMPAAELVRVGQAGGKFYKENLSMKIGINKLEACLLRLLE